MVDLGDSVRDRRAAETGLVREDSAADARRDGLCDGRAGESSDGIAGAIALALDEMSGELGMEL